MLTTPSIEPANFSRAKATPCQRAIISKFLVIENNFFVHKVDSRKVFGRPQSEEIPLTNLVFIIPESFQVEKAHRKWIKISISALDPKLNFEAFCSCCVKSIFPFTKKSFPIFEVRDEVQMFFCD
jgi:hypothetical protein